jgi:hypothetical protein
VRNRSSSSSSDLTIKFAVGLQQSSGCSPTSVGEHFQVSNESLILAQNQRWRRA